MSVIECHVVRLESSW